MCDGGAFNPKSEDYMQEELGSDETILDESGVGGEAGCCAGCQWCRRGSRRERGLLWERSHERRVVGGLIGKSAARGGGLEGESSAVCKGDGCMVFERSWGICEYGKNASTLLYHILKIDP